jgi:hypothetical protein
MPQLSTCCVRDRQLPSLAADHQNNIWGAMRATRFVVPTLLGVLLVCRRAGGQTAMAQVRLAIPPATAPAANPLGSPATTMNPVTLTAMGTGDTTSATSGSRNPYVGAQAGYVFGGGDFASNLIANGSVVYQVLQASGKTSKGRDWSFFLPIRGNVSSLVASKDSAARNKQIQSLVSGAQGIRVAIEPYLTLPSVGFLSSALFASAGWKLNAVKDSADTTHYLALGRFAVGLESIIGPKDGSKNPILIDLSPVYSTFAGRDYRAVKGLEKAIWSGEMTIIVPIGASTGLLTEAIVSQRSFPVWRTGIILTAASK